MPDQSVKLEQLKKEIEELRNHNALLAQELQSVKKENELLQQSLDAVSGIDSDKKGEIKIAQLYKETQAFNEELRASEEELRQSLDSVLELNEKIAESEVKYRLISENMRDIICLHDVDSTYKYVSPSVTKVLGYEPAEMLGKNPYLFFHPEDIEFIRYHAHEKAVKNGLDNYIEFRFRHKDGYYIWMECILGPLLDDTGNIYGLHTATRDISQRKQLEKERDNFFNYSVDIMAIIGFDRKIIRINTAWEHTLGFYVIDSEGKSIEEFIHPEDLYKIADILTNQFARQEKTIDLEVRFRSHDGSYRWISWTSVPFPQEEIVYVFGKDITYRKQTEETLTLAQLSIDIASDTIFWLDVKGCILRVNKAACELLGYSEQELLRLKIHDIDPEFNTAIWTSHWQELKEKGSFTFESRYRAKDGTLIPIEVNANYFEYEGKEYNFAYGRDISERKKTEEKLRFNNYILSNVNDAIIGVDLTYNINYWSESAEQRYGLKAEIVMGKPLAEVYTLEWLHPNDMATTNEALAQHGFCKVEVIHVLYNGKRIFVEAYIQHLQDLQGNTIGLLGIIHDITERKLAEVRMLEQDLMLQNIFNESSDALFLVEYQKRNIIKCNRTAIRLFEADSEDELIGQFGHNLQKQPFTQQEAWALDQAIENEGEWSSEVEYVSIKGRQFWGNITIKLIRIVDHMYRLVRITDITNRKQSQAELLSYAQRSINILESITDAFMILDHQWRVTYFNKQAELILYITREEVLNRSIWEVYPSAIESNFYKQYNKAFQENTDVHFEDYFHVLDTWLEVHAYPSAEGLSVYFRNVNERKKAEKAIQESEEKFRSLTTHSPVGIFTTSSDGLCTWTNPRLQEIAGFTFGEAQGEGWLNFVHPEDVKAALSDWNTYEYISFPLVNEYRFLHKNGNIRWVRITTNPVYAGTDIRNGYVGTVEDITERREAEEKLQSTLDELKKRNHELDNYVYKVSHDLRAPLTSIMGLVNLTKIETDPEAIKHYIDLIENRVQKSDQFIQSILSHSKILNSQIKVSAIDFRKIILESFEQLKYMPNSDRIHINVRMRDEQVFYGDDFRIDIILKNFISNAIKYMNPYQDENYVNFNIHLNKKEATILIEDNGLGIEKKYQPNIFDMFFRATEKSDGSGLGLYIVRQTIERMGGSVSLESETGKGTTFIINLPNLGNAQN